MKKILITSFILLFSINSYAQEYNNNYSYSQEDIQGELIMPDIQPPNKDYYLKFFNTFKNARMYFNFSSSVPNLLCKNIYKSKCEKPYDERTLTGDFFITDFIQDGISNFFIVNINQKKYYIESGTFISYFDTQFFFEMPKYYSSNYREQLNIFLERIVNNNLSLNPDSPLTVFICESKIQTYDCGGIDVSQNDNIYIQNYNPEQLMFTAYFNNEKIYIPAALLSSLLSNFILIREKF